MAAELTVVDLVNAASFGDLATVKTIIEAGVHPDDYPNYSMPAITCAACEGHISIIEYLLSQKANPNNYTKNRSSALKSAAKYNKHQVVKLLLDNGADPNYEKDGQVALTIAADNQAKESLKILLAATDSKYYQQAYQYSPDKKIRQLIQRHSPDQILIDSVNGYGGPASRFAAGTRSELDSDRNNLSERLGGPTYKRKMHYSQPPTDPVLKQVWELLQIHINELNRNPSEAMLWILIQQTFKDYPEQYYINGQLHLGEKICPELKYLLQREDLRDKYLTIYQHVNEIEIYSDSDDE